MDGASGAFAVVSLAIQLFEIVQETSKFVKNISNAPSELMRLGETLGQLGSVLGYVRQLLEQQLLVLRLPGSPIFILEALQNCERGLKPLKEIVNKAKDAPNDYRTKRVWKSLRFVMKKEQIEELQSQLRDAKSDLQFAVSANSWQLQMHHLEFTSEIALLNMGTVKKQPPADMPNNAIVSRVEANLDRCTVRSKRPLSHNIEQTDRTWYKGTLGLVRVHRRLKRNGYCSNDLQDQMCVAMEEDSFVISPSFMGRVFELRFCNSFGRIARSLSIYPVMKGDEPIFKMCQRGDMNGMQVALSGGSLSPFVLDSHGRTLLHHAAMYFHSDLCFLLLHLGVNPDTSSSYGQTALQRVAIPGVCDEYGGDLTSFATPIVDTLRVLSQAQTDFSLADIKYFTRLYSGPPLGVEFLLLHDTSLAGTPDQYGKEKSAFAFATAVSLFGKGSMQWESMIRRLIREGVDIHGQVRRCRSEPWFSDGSLATPRISGTPLDELFIATDTPSQSQTVGNSWLRILASEGVDILAYLEEEIELHKAQQFSTWSTFLLRRKLVFQLGEIPSVWWDWQLDPESSALLVREVYKSLNMANDDDYFGPCKSDTPQRDTWPWGYPGWYRWPWSPAVMPESVGHDDMSEMNRQCKLAEDRAARRMARKAFKLRRPLGLKNVSSMPGAWPL